jgi:tetratricopeptide (TPR) repeat protein
MPPTLEADQVELRFTNGVSFVRLGKHEEAMKCYDRAIELGPDFVAWNNKAGCLFRLSAGASLILSSQCKTS